VRVEGGSVSSAPVVFHRRVLDTTKQDFMDEIEADQSLLGEFETKQDEAIEDGWNTLQIDFANKYLGGGVLNTGCIQEEIRFMISPECLLGLLFTEVMTHNEAIIIKGVEQFSKYTGYSFGFKYAGNFDHAREAPKSAKRDQTVIVAIDAVRLTSPLKQFLPGKMLREIFKAYVGFSVPPKDMDAPKSSGFKVISTGNWGCGAFGGDVSLKSMLQWIAATKAGRVTHYYPYGDVGCDALPRVVRTLQEQKVTVSQLWEELKKYCESIESVYSYHSSPERDDDATTPKYTPADGTVFDHLVHAFSPKSDTEIISVDH